MRAPDESLDERNLMPRRVLAALWVLWSIWLVARPVEIEKTSITAEARRELAIFGFALVMIVVYGLLRTWRWPVTASRALVVALIVGVIVGPAGRAVWIYVIDVGFALAGSALAFVKIRMGTAPPPRAASEWTARRIARKQEMFRSRRRRP